MLLAVSRAEAPLRSGETARSDAGDESSASPRRSGEGERSGERKLLFELPLFDSRSRLGESDLLRDSLSMSSCFLLTCRSFDSADRDIPGIGASLRTEFGELPLGAAGDAEGDCGRTGEGERFDAVEFVPDGDG